MNQTPRATGIQPPATPQDVASDDLPRIYGLLKRGLGHELVSDDNVKGLIELARRDGHTLIETELREWRNPCAPAPPPDGPA